MLGERDDEMSECTFMPSLKTSFTTADLHGKRSIERFYTDQLKHVEKKEKKLEIKRQQIVEKELSEC